MLIENSQKLKIKNYLIYNKLYYFGLLTGSSIFLLHTKYLYGFYSFNPGRILSYGVSPLNIIDEYLLKHKLYNLFDPRIVIEVILDFYRILFSQEFGLLWFSPVLFFLFYVIARFLFSKKISLFFILALIVSIPTGLVILWLTAASSFGYRYLFCLIPLAIYVCFEYLNKTELKILYVLNLISIILYLVFETNELTSLRSQVNIFNEFTCCSARYYINGAFDSFMQLTTFIKIIGTSFISVFIFKVLSSFISLENSITLLDNFGVNVNDVSEIIIYSFNISYFEISIYIALISFFTYKATKEYYNF